MHYAVHDVIFITFMVIFFLALFRTGQKILQWFENSKTRRSGLPPQPTGINNLPR